MFWLANWIHNLKIRNQCSLNILDCIHVLYMHWMRLHNCMTVHARTHACYVLCSPVHSMFNFIFMFYLSLHLCVVWRVRWKFIVIIVVVDLCVTSLTQVIPAICGTNYQCFFSVSLSPHLIYSPLSYSITYVGLVATLCTEIHCTDCNATTPRYHTTHFCSHSFWFYSIRIHFNLDSLLLFTWFECFTA